MQEPTPGEPVEAPKEAPKEAPAGEEGAAAPQAAAAGKTSGTPYTFNVNAPEFKPSSSAQMSAAEASPSSQPREFVPSSHVATGYQGNEFYAMQHNQPHFSMAPHQQGPPHEQWVGGAPHPMRYMQQHPGHFPSGPHGPFPYQPSMMMPQMPNHMMGTNTVG